MTLFPGFDAIFGSNPPYSVSCVRYIVIGAEILDLRTSVSVTMGEEAAGGKEGRDRSVEKLREVRESSVEKLLEVRKSSVKKLLEVGRDQWILPSPPPNITHILY